MSNGFPRRSASLPDWLVKIKEFIFGSHQDHDELSLPTYRRTPLISGSLIPFSILLEIPGLTEHWYVRTYGLQIVETRRNPALVNVSLTFSMALAVIANIALIYRFLERSVKRSTIICIFALTLHDLLNIVTIVTFGIQHRFNDGFTTGEAFWMTICSTIVSTITNLTLIWDLRKTPNFAEAGTGITRKQRSLVIITIIFLAYIALGALFSSLAMSLTFLDGLFFTLVTTLTIGFGDIVPKTATQRVVVCLYAVFGIIILGSGVRLTSEAVLEGLQVGYRRRLKEYKMRRKARKHEREQVRRWRAAVEECLVERGLEVWTPDKPVLASSGPNTRPTTLRRGSNFVSQPMYLNTEALPRVVLESAAREAGVPPERFIGRKFGRRARQTYRRHHHYDQQRRQDEPEGDRRGRVPMDITWTIDDGGLQEHRNGNWSSAWWERARHALHLANAGDASSVPQGDPFPSMTAQEMIKDIERDERRSLYTKLGFAWAVFFTFWLIGSVIFSKTENWGYGSAMYFCFIAFTTIGYGDLAPKTALGRSIFVVWALFGVGAMTILIAVVSDAFSSKYHSVMHDKRFDRAVRRYRQGQEKAMRGQVKEDSNRSASAQVMPVLQANLARISSREPGQPTIVSEPAQTLEEAEARLRARIEPLPAMILKEVLRLRDHTRYFLVSNGHASAWNLHTVPGANDVLTTSRAVIPEDLKEVLDEIAREEGFEERLKQEVWDDPHARNTLFLLSLEKGARKMVEAAELALETLAERNELRVLEERVDEEEIE
ncbi:voltage-gated potassium channel [Russula earlei]|uniref:Voltage-gated potassium channel n=1 Tax=Russula earlei TaxID=71964 RepID=A0ACC0U8I3_9AGAM|nr:voltage-gated potassium channel [Russula earlei]